MKNLQIITLDQVAAAKRADVRNYEENREYVGNTETDNRIGYVLNMSDEDYMNLHNEVVRREALKSAAAKEKAASISAERKATGMSKKAYRAEYDRLNALYKSGDYSVKAEMKRIQKYAF